jgi:hypothetical protein
MAEATRATRNARRYMANVANVNFTKRPKSIPPSKIVDSSRNWKELAPFAPSIRYSCPMKTNNADLHLKRISSEKAPGNRAGARVWTWERRPNGIFRPSRLPGNDGFASGFPAELNIRPFASQGEFAEYLGLALSYR